MFRFIWYHSRVFKLLLNNESLNPTARDGLPPYKCLVRDAPEASKTMLAVADALSCPPELDSKSLLQKAPYTLTTAHKKKKSSWNKTGFILSACQIPLCQKVLCRLLEENSLTQL